MGDVDADILGNEEAKDGEMGGWNEEYLQQVFGNLDEIEDDDVLALEHLGELEYQRQMSEQNEI